MFVRVKKISGRRYLYLVEGIRSKKKVRQRTLAYLGELSELACGVSKSKRMKIESKLGRKADWAKIRDQIRQIPLSFQELNGMRRRQFAISVKSRDKSGLIRRRNDKLRVTPSEIFSQRTEGELRILTKLATISFRKRFQKIGERAYQMRS